MIDLKNLTTRFRLGVCALSSPTKGAREVKIKEALGYLRDHGFSIREGVTTWSNRGYKSADLTARIEDFNTLIRDPNIDLIIATTGGFNSNEILEYIDYEAIRARPKWIVGYSDMTAVLLAVYARAGVSTVCGPMLVDYYDYPRCFVDLFEAITAPKRTLENHGQLWERRDGNHWTTPQIQVLEGKETFAEGRAVAGNLSTFNLLLGTPFLPALEGAVLFLEYDKEEQHALPAIERFLWQIRHSGTLRRIKGLVFGALQPGVAAESDENDGIDRILRDVCLGYDFPVLMNAQFGHCYPSWVVVNGQGVVIRGTVIEVGVAVS